MKRILSYCILAIMATASLFAQDIIVTTDAQKIEAKIIEVSKSEIKYKEKDNLNGPTFVLETKEISSVIYSNGKVVLYNQQPSSEMQKEDSSTQPTTPQKPTADESMADILLLSGNVITAQITALKGNYVAYIQDGKDYTIPASQIEKVTFLQNGQVKEYHGRSTSVTPTRTPTPAAQKTEETKQASSSSTKTSDPVFGRIYRDNGQYMHNNTYISSKEVARILERENSVAYNEWEKAEGMYLGGSICVGVGAGLAAGGLICLIFKDYTACIGLDCAAIVPLGIGLGLTLGASSHYNKAINIYNSKYDHTAMQLKWYVAPNSIGLAFAF